MSSSALDLGFVCFCFPPFFSSPSEKLSNNKVVKSKGFKTLLGWATRAALFRTALMQTESEPIRGAMRLKAATTSTPSKERNLGKSGVQKTSSSHTIKVVHTKLP